MIEGLLLFAAPDAWKAMAMQLLAQPAAVLRRIGALAIAGGLLALWWLRY